jgi:hypothetical protein
MLDVSALGVSGAGFLFGVGVSLYFDVASLGGSHAYRWRRGLPVLKIWLFFM